MAHQVHQTEGFVVRGINVGEGNRYLTLFTKEYGLVKALARSVREERSKLRYALQDFSYSYLSLVRGREVWRLTGAVNVKRIDRMFAIKDPSKQELIARIFSLLPRLLGSDESHPHLFADLADAIDMLASEEGNTPHLNALEPVLLLRTLHELGYVAPQSDFARLLRPAGLRDGCIHMNNDLAPTVITHINAALDASHL